jgi:hypothetical protein
MCAASHLCRFTDEPQSADCLWYINCNRLAHEGCVKPILVQAPFDGCLSLCIDDLDHGTISWFSKLTNDEGNEVVVCILFDRR